MRLSRILIFGFAAFVCLTAAAPASAQLIPDWAQKSFKFEQLDADRIRLVGEAELIGEAVNKGTQIFADSIELNITTGEFVATGNVTLSTPTARLTAERVVYNTKTGLGEFHTAFGMASLGERGLQQRSMFGTLEPEVYFYGQRINKIGEDRYQIVNGGFTTCVQPTPRWDIVSGKATIDLEDYAVLRNAVVRVKDVPVFYLPVLYYPIQSDDRATGFLMPTYGTSLYRGKSISNAFFWAINRSQDLTLMHDWYAKTGQGMGGEYRYVAGPGAEGLLRAFWLNQKAAVHETPTGDVTTPASRSFEIKGTMVQPLGGGVTARAIMDYFSDLQTKQLTHYDIRESSLARRSIIAGVTKTWSNLTLSSNYNRSEVFYSQTSSVLNGQAPQVNAALSSRRIGMLPLYVAATADASNILYISRSYVGDLVSENDAGLKAFDTSGTLRAPFTGLSFLTATGTFNYRFSRYSHSLDLNGRHVAEPLTRQYADMRFDLVGPVLSRVYSPQNAVADRLKHVIEPTFSISRITPIENEQRISSQAGSVIVGDVTRMSYGIANRLLVRKTPAPKPGEPAPVASAGAPRELLSVSLTQSYYTNKRASTYDYTYSLSYNYRQPNNFSPVAIVARALPTANSQVNFRTEYDIFALKDRFQGFSLTGGLRSQYVEANAGWSTRRYPSGSLLSPDDYLQWSTTVSDQLRRFVITSGFDLDVKRKALFQRRFIGSYNAQCCGLAVEFQEYVFPANSGFPIPKDRRFNISFSLAGIGTFSNFFGTFGSGSR